MTFGTLYTLAEYDRTATILIAAKCKNILLTVKNITQGKENLTREFLAKFPLGKVPALETSTGFTLYETKAIEYYIASQGTEKSAKLLGDSMQEEALITQFITLAENELVPAAEVWLYPLHGWNPANPMFTNRAKQDVKKILKILDSHLVTRTYLVGERITLADIAVSMCLKEFFTMVLDQSWRSEFRNLTRWFVTCVNQKNFVDVIGNVKLCEKEITQFVGKATETVKLVEKKSESATVESTEQKTVPESLYGNHHIESNSDRTMTRGRGGPARRGGGRRGGSGRGGAVKRPSKIFIEPHRHNGIFIARSETDLLVTKNLVPGESVYGEKLISVDEDGMKVEYREWNPFLCNIAAAVLGGIDSIWLNPGDKVLYLGAANGASVSHISDIVGPTGMVYAVEISRQCEHDLMNVARKRPNVIPIMGDARHPDRYQMLVGTVDTLYAELEVHDQSSIIASNMHMFLKAGGRVLISIKTECIDSSAIPAAVFAQEVNKLKEEQVKPMEQLTLEPYQRDQAIVSGM
ncbi:hypothetical protein HK098_000358 [Nowakowskiella sp. JEL0407]|nr:hypothetical protein HK098_000358 [Nowakowskiella sp. JEL0407]